MAALATAAIAAGACSTSRPTTPQDGGTPSACTFDAGPPEDVPSPAIHTPAWAFEPWISKDISNDADTRDFVEGFRQRDIPVGVVVLDSPWATNYNTFVPNPSRYPAFEKLVSDMHAKAVRVVLWTTAFVNESSFDLEPGGDRYDGPAAKLEEGRACNYFVNDGDGYFWWKGRGATVDFFNPGARTWWHRQQDRVLDLGNGEGIDGWKLDFGESYVTAPAFQTAAGQKTLQEYSEAYYADFQAYGAKKRGKAFTTLVRAWDESYQFTGRFFARKENAPITWMGDNRRDFVGLADALDEMFRSAKAGYVVVGSDVGGYLDRDDKQLTVEIPYNHPAFCRWVALGAMSPFMQLHGRANLTPWTVPVDPTGFVALYRTWATLHHELVPFFYSVTEEAYAKAGTILVPQGNEVAWKGDYRFVLGGAFLVAPILDATGKRDVALPAGARWYDWNDPTAAAKDGGTTVLQYDATDLSKMPLFVREGAIVPARVGNDVTGLGTAASKAALTWAVWPGATKESFVLHDEDGTTTTATAERTVQTTRIALSRTPERAILRVRVDTAPSTVTVAGTTSVTLADRTAFDATTAGWFHDAAKHLLWVHVPPNATATEILAAP
jgi:alpha-glucosidase (family GH31 glycosyl hydrolase)